MIRSLCANHPHEAAVATCARCGSFLCRRCLFDEGRSLCEACDVRRLASVMGRASRTGVRRILTVGAVLSLAGAALLWSATETQFARAAAGRFTIGLVLALVGVVFLGLGFTSWFRLRRTIRNAPSYEGEDRSTPAEVYPSLPVDVLLARMAGARRPFFVCVDCKALFPEHAAAFSGCPRCHSVGACLEVRDEGDAAMVKSALGV